MIGLLITLQINNWNEANKQRAIEETYFKRLDIDLNDNADLWKKTHERKLKQLESAKIFLNFSFSQNKDNIYKIMPYFSAIDAWEYININQVTFEEMISSGHLDIISNDSIKLKLLNLNKHYKEILNYQNTLELEHRTRILEPIMDIMNTSYVLPLDPKMSKIINREFTPQEKMEYGNKFKAEMVDLIEDKAFLNGLLGIVYNSESQFDDFEKAKAQVEELIALINDERLKFKK